VLADRANGGRRRFAGDNLCAYAEKLRLEMERRELKYARIVAAIVGGFLGALWLGVKALLGK
jgi:hypothetical protein